ncbi:transcriptional regulator, XRE family [Thiolapillus brandeum]|uniref:Transcriptional regulator, XRE family n=2 Tax=Thiolapillus brandeum TaxID=1076588 RepID=A0A7U6GHT2_9GAMM|nr:transcriptional regulator, XRE family [Thiolapillus brandeum]
MHMKQENQQLNIPNKVKQLRKSRGITQVDMAGLLGVTQSKISRLERGVIPITVDELAAIADVLDVPVYTLFQFDQAA